MNPRLKLSLLALFACAALALAACGGDPQELQAADTAALVAAPAAQLLAPEAPDPEPARRAFTPVVAPGEGLQLAEESFSEKDEKRRYEIALTFPQLKGRLSPNAFRFNRAVRALVAREAHEFKRGGGAKGLSRPGDEAWHESYESLTGRYEFVHLDERLASLRFALSAHGRGAAHPTRFQRVLNFDLKEGRALRLDDLFKPESQHLRALAARCVAALRRQDEEAHRGEVARVTAGGQPASRAGVRTPDSDFESGAGPDAENYRAWNLSAEGVVVTFAACQVFGCAAGEQEVLVPFSALGEILNEDGPAARLRAR